MGFAQRSQSHEDEPQRFRTASRQPAKHLKKSPKDSALSVRIPAELHAAVAAWIEALPDPKPSRSDAVRRLLEKALALK